MLHSNQPKTGGSFLCGPISLRIYGKVTGTVIDMKFLFARGTNETLIVLHLPSYFLFEGV
jgi:hypothetical protein